MHNFLTTHNYLLSSAVPVEVGYIIAVIATLSGVVGVLFKMYDSVRKEERERLIFSYEKQIEDKNKEIAKCENEIKTMQAERTSISNKVIEVLEYTNEIARENLRNRNG